MLYALLFAPAYAWNVTETPDGQPFHFPKMPIHWRFDPEGAPQELDAEAQHAAVEAAFEAWSAVPETEVSFVHDPDGPPQGVSRIYWAEEWSSNTNYLAITTTDASATGQITTFEMALNPNISWTTTPNAFDMDFRNTVTHEIGHGIGLAHSEVAEATMYAETLPGDVEKRDLASDDAEAMQFLYPTRNAEKTPLEQLLGCNGTGTSASSVSLASLILPLFRFRRRRTASVARRV